MVTLISRGVGIDEGREREHAREDEPGQDREGGEETEQGRHSDEPRSCGAGGRERASGNGQDCG